MATYEVNAIPDEITALDGNESTLTFPLLDGEKDGLVAKLTVTSGGPVKFNTIGLADLSSLDVANGESVTVTLSRGRDLAFIANAADDTFKIEI